jgi:hypothetical protein
MKRLLPIIVVLLLMIPGGLWAQLDPVSSALRAYQSNELIKAKEFIEVASTDSNFNTQSKTWFFKGYIYKDLYKENKNSEEGHAYRNTAIESYIKTIELDQTNEFVDDCQQSLKYIASTLFNDAAAALDTNNIAVAQEYYTAYKELSKVTNPEMDFTLRDVEFKLYKASKYSIMYDNTEPGSNVDELSEKITGLYSEVLILDSNNVSANYNLAIHYYNQGVYIIDNMDYELPFEELFAIQEKVMELFQKALPYMLKAYKLDPTRKATLQGLSGIYFGLNDIDKSEFFQGELEKLGGK